MKRFFFLFTISISLISCHNKSLQLPQVPVAGESEKMNHSQIWVFYENESAKADLNKNNTISSTDWIINIDKRLVLSEVIPVFQMIKKKRAKKSIHSVEGMQNFLTYSDTGNKKIALFSIDSIQYMMQSQAEIAKIEQEIPCDYTLEFNKDAIWFNQQKFPTDQWQNLLLDTLTSGRIQLHFDSKLSYQDYMLYRLSLKDRLYKEVLIEETEYIIK